MKKLSAAANALLLAALCAVLVLSSIYCMVSGLSLKAPTTILPVVVCCSIVFCGLFSLKRGWIAFLAVGALLLAFTFIRLDSLKESFAALGKFLLNLYNSGYHWFSEEPFAKTLPPHVIEPAMLSLAVWMTLLVSFSAVYLKSTLLCGIFLLPCVVSCFILTDTPPDAVYPLLVLGCMLLLSLTQHCRKTDTVRSPLAMLYFAVLSAALLAVLCVCTPLKQYNHAALVGSITERINLAWATIRGDVLSGLGTTSPDTVNLHQQKTAPNSMRTVMYVTSQETQPLYLFGRAYERFADDKWSVAKNHRMENPAILALSVLPSQLQIATVAVSDVLYVSYGMVKCTADTGTWDAYCENGRGVKEYQVEYYLAGAQCLWIAPTAEYSQYVYENCLSLPEKTREGLLAWGLENLPADPSPQQIADAVQQSAVYSRYPRAIPNDADLAVYFLNEAESGFCVQFATATAELLRAYGYPSRYVTGYLTQTEAGQTVSVPEKSAHAWAEYYDLNMGWVRLDATPEEGAAEPVEHTQPSGVVTPSEREPTEPTERETEHKPRPQEGGTKDKGGQSRKAELPIWVWIVLAAVVLIAALPLRRSLCIKARKRKLQKGTTNEQLCALWRDYSKVCRHINGVPDKGLHALAQKAGFSAHEITREELYVMQTAVLAQAEAVGRLPLPKRLFVKYILAAV